MAAIGSFPVELHSVGGKHEMVGFKRLSQRCHKLWIKPHIIVNEKEQIAAGRLRSSIQGWCEPYVHFQR